MSWERERKEMGKNVRFGIIGCGLMGREFASAAARWQHFTEEIPQPQLIAVCDVNPSGRKWFTNHVPTVQYE